MIWEAICALPAFVATVAIGTVAAFIAVAVSAAVSFVVLCVAAGVHVAITGEPL